jgi:hypothetical protein
VPLQVPKDWMQLFLGHACAVWELRATTLNYGYEAR